ncbi:MAG: hypothetical protein ACLQK4_09440 [Acidimicrobiales bacterium]|jgi:hypothetical protein
MSGARHACVLCVPGQGHHPTRRPSASEPYYDSALRLWLCSVPPHNHHARVHEALRSLDLDLRPEGMDPLTYRIRVLGAHAGVFADAGAAFAVADAAASRALQALLLEVADALPPNEERVA